MAHECSISAAVILFPQALFLFELLSKTTRRPEELLR